MFCKNCGKKANDNDKFCTNCGAKLSNTNENKGNNNKKSLTNDENNIANILSISSFFIMIFGLPIICFIDAIIPQIKNITNSIKVFLPEIALILLIYTRVKYPQNKLSKILLIIYIVFYIIVILSIVIFFIIIGIKCYGCGANFGQIEFKI